MEISGSTRRALESYFEAFTEAIHTYLRPYHQKLGHEWVGLGKHRRTVVLYITEEGVVASLTAKWLGSPVQVSQQRSFSAVTRARFTPRPRPKRGEKIGMFCILRRLSGDSRIKMSAPSLDETAFHWSAPASVLLLQAELLTLRCESGKGPPRDEDIVVRHTPNWVLQFVAFRPASESEIMDGLDDDPLIQAHAVSEVILNAAGIRPEPPDLKFRRAREALQEGLETERHKNEDALHTVIDEHPWILVEECEIASFQSKPHLRYTVRQPDGRGGFSKETRSFFPDFLYDRHSHDTLVVEIEAATKALLKGSKETGLRLPAAPGSAATMQIGNYKRLFDDHRSELLEQLEKPDKWPLRFLLVIDNTVEVDAHWLNMRAALEDQGVHLRSWSYYLDRLQRLENSAQGFRRP